MKRVRWIWSIQKELQWFEEMAMKGWHLKDITCGILYTFEMGEPKRMLYDVERFNIPKKPSTEDIRHKEMFLDMAQEMGWQEVTHDELMDYYFVKEYEEDGINELHNDEESRCYRAKKFRDMILAQTKTMLICMMILAFCNLFSQFVGTGETSEFFVWYDRFTSITSLVLMFFILFYAKLAKLYEKELSMTRAEWLESKDADKHRVVHRLIVINRGLNRFLKKQEAKGWVLKSMTSLNYYFDKDDAGKHVYTLDSNWLIRKRAKENAAKYAYKKDWLGNSTDWMIQSLKDANDAGWEFVCATDNRRMLYKGESNSVVPLNDAKYDKRIGFISLIGQYAFTLICCGIVGGIIGALVGYFELL